MALPEKPSFNAAPNLISAKTWPDGTVWHYTTGAGLAGLVGGKVLWASATGFMNDVNELKTGQAVFEELVANYVVNVDEKIRGNFTAMVKTAMIHDSLRTFVACASRQPDRLTMWRNYTSEVGYAVALDGKKPLFMRRQRPMT